MTSALHAGSKDFYQNVAGALRFFSANASKASIGTTLADFTGIGAIYNLGGDLAGLGLANRTIKVIRQEKEALRNSGEIQQFVAKKSCELCEEHELSIKHSMIAKTGYLAGMALTLVGLCWGSLSLTYSGLFCMAVPAVGMLAKAGFNSIDRSTQERTAQLLNLCNQEIKKVN